MLHSTVGHDFAKMLTAAKRLAPSARVVGCTCTSVIGKKGANEHMKALAVMAIKGDPGQWCITHSGNVRGRTSFEQARTMAEEAKKQCPNANMVMLSPQIAR